MSDKKLYTEKSFQIRDVKPNYSVNFSNKDGEVGELDFNGSSMIFRGNAEESAKVFFDWIAQSFEKRLEEERAAEREKAAKVCESMAPKRQLFETDKQLTKAAASIRGMK